MAIICYYYYCYCFGCLSFRRLCFFFFFFCFKKTPLHASSSLSSQAYVIALLFIRLERALGQSTHVRVLHFRLFAMHAVDSGRLSSLTVVCHASCGLGEIIIASVSNRCSFSFLGDAGGEGTGVLSHICC